MDLKNEPEGTKYDMNKPRWDLLPLEEIADVVDVYTTGANKYGADNWKKLKNGYNRFKAALFRHLVAYERGETKDPDTGCRHLAQVAWNAIAMLYFSKKNEEAMWKHNASTHEQAFFDFMNNLYYPKEEVDEEQRNKESSNA